MKVLGKHTSIFAIFDRYYTFAFSLSQVRANENRSHYFFRDFLLSTRSIGSCRP